MPAVSVVVPAFNAQDFIVETLESVVKQTYSDLDIIVVDDGSTDATRERVAAMGRGVTLLTQKNGRAAKARNAGAAAGDSEWIAFLDADDLWLPDKLERQLARASATAAPFVFTDRLNIGAKGPLPERQSEIQPLREGDIFETLLHGNFITTSTVLLRRDVFNSMGGFSEDPDLPPAEDWDLWLRVVEHHAAAACHEPLVKYRHHQMGASRNVERMNRARSLVVARALALRRGRRLSQIRRRKIWAETWLTNGWDAARHNRPTFALKCYGRSLAAWPLSPSPYIATLRLLAGRT
jgi:glycosyltransferase involved in cell wall biosynthesis